MLASAVGLQASHFTRKKSTLASASKDRGETWGKINIFLVKNREGGNTREGKDSQLRNPVQKPHLLIAELFSSPQCLIKKGWKWLHRFSLPSRSRLVSKVTKNVCIRPRDKDSNNWHSSPQNWNPLMELKWGQSVEQRAQKWNKLRAKLFSRSRTKRSA